MLCDTLPIAIAPSEFVEDDVPILIAFEPSPLVCRPTAITPEEKLVLKPPNIILLSPLLNERSPITTELLPVPAIPFPIVILLSSAIELIPILIHSTPAAADD